MALICMHLQNETTSFVSFTLQWVSDLRAKIVEVCKAYTAKPVFHGTDQTGTDNNTVESIFDDGRFKGNV